MLVDSSTRTTNRRSIGTEGRPFLKWAGGKRQLLPALRRVVPVHFAGYHEPFLGSAALFFDLANAGRLREATLTDTNAVLVGCYAAIRRDVSEVIAALHALAAVHRREGSACYYDARGRFNLASASWLAGGASLDDYDAGLAALFIYLNRTGFNGLFRLNASGAFNVPAGRYRNPRICDEDVLRQAAAALSIPTIALRHAPWDAVLEAATRDDFVYLDPPYAPLTSTARFTSYTAGGFGEADQRRLADAVVALARRGCHVVLSNSSAPLVLELYQHNRDVRAAGLRTFQVPARRAINADPAKRGAVMECIVTNVPEVVER